MQQDTGQKVCFVQTPAAEPLRIDQFLSQQSLDLSRSAIQRLIKSGRATLDGKIAKASDKIRPGQTCCIELDEQSAHPPSDLQARHMDLEIIFEDEHILAINKPAGLSVHPGAGKEDVTLAHGILAHAQATLWPGERQRPGIVHRLDKDTSGLIVIAKTERAHRDLSRQFAERGVKKEYWALSWGTWDRRAETVDAPIGRSRTDRKKMAVVTTGRPAQTDFNVLAQFRFCAEIAAFPHTGRTHQIRVHLAHLHHPVVGDSTYGGAFSKRLGSIGPSDKEAARDLSELVNRQMLHARRIAFDHPATGKRITLEAPLSADIVRVKEFLTGF